MSLDQLVSGLVYLLAAFVLFILGKVAFDKVNRNFVLRVELLERDNFAVALAVVGYYLGLILAIGGVLMGPSTGWVNDLIDIFFFGIISIVLLNVSSVINDRFILYKFNNEKEIIQDRNAGTGIIVGGNHIATGLIIAGAISGEEGDLITAGAFWILGQLALIVASLIYNRITPFDVHDEIEKDNVAVGVSFAGMLIAVGNVIRVGISGDFVSWSANLGQFASFVVFGLVLLPFVRMFTDKVLLPKHRLTDELVNQEIPNVGAGALEAFSYIAASMLIGWVV